jgi:hypothetical protein
VSHRLFYTKFENLSCQKEDPLRDEFALLSQEYHIILHSFLNARQCSLNHCQENAFMRSFHISTMETQNTSSPSPLYI